ncbi:alpha/beta fold hydrolase [Paenibacillus sp. 1P07SE]|uniref:alpha/beta fold hydrolase n=1 Tax=Paenibacillus sp. 1P07SE TaxID=3132209 RepID=UPI0039A73694
MENPNPHARELTYRGARIAYSVQGPVAGEALVMIHAAFADRQLFEDQCSYFSKACRVLTLDLPGHGRTIVKGTRVVMGDMPDILAALLDQEGIAACHLLGVSMGSLVAQAFADRYPSRVRSLTIVGGYSIHKANDNVLKAQRKETLSWFVTGLIAFERFKRRIVKQCCTTQRGQQLLTRSSASFTRRSFLAMDGMQRFFVPKDDPAPYPLLLVYGSEDLPVIREAMQALHQAEPDCQLMELAGAGHCANADDPAAFNRTLAAFIGIPMEQ